MVMLTESLGPAFKASGPHLKPRAGILLEVDLSVLPESYYYYYSTLVAVGPSPGATVAVSESMNRDLNRVSLWCNLWGMKLNALRLRL